MTVLPEITFARIVDTSLPRDPRLGRLSRKTITGVHLVVHPNFGSRKFPRVLPKARSKSRRVGFEEKKERKKTKKQSNSTNESTNAHTRKSDSA